MKQVVNTMFNSMTQAGNAVNEWTRELEFAGFKLVASDAFSFKLQNRWYTLAVKTNGAAWTKNLPGASYSKYRYISESILEMLTQIDYGTHYVYVGGVALCPLQKFGYFNSPDKLLELSDFLCRHNAELAHHSEKVFRWRLKNGKEVEIKQSSVSGYGTESLTEEETTMDIFSLVAAANLYDVKVRFNSGGSEYSYKSEVAYEPGDKVVVDSPNSGLVVVTVTECSQGLQGGNFPKYKWVVGKVDTARYEELVANEANAIARIEAAKRADKVRKELEALGVSQDDVLKMLGLATKSDSQ